MPLQPTDDPDVERWSTVASRDIEDRAARHAASTVRPWTDQIWRPSGDHVATSRCRRPVAVSCPDVRAVDRARPGWTGAGPRSSTSTGRDAPEREPGAIRENVARSRCARADDQWRSRLPVAMSMRGRCRRPPHRRRRRWRRARTAGQRCRARARRSGARRRQRRSGRAMTSSQAQPGRVRREPRRLHGEPPFEARPPRPLAGDRGLRKDLTQMSGQVEGRHRRRSHSAMVARSDLGRHAGRPSIVSWPSRSRRRAPPAAGRRPRCSAGLRRAERNPERGRDLRQRQVEVIVKDDQGPLFGLEADEPASSSSRSTIVDSRSGDRRPRASSMKLDVDPVAPRAAAPHRYRHGRAAGEATGRSDRDPGAWAGRARPGRARSARRPSPVRAPGGSARRPRPDGDRGGCQRGEGVMIALPRPLHELSLHPEPRSWCSHSAVLAGLWRGMPPDSFPNRRLRSISRAETRHGERDASCAGEPAQCRAATRWAGRPQPQGARRW